MNSKDLKIHNISNAFIRIEYNDKVLLCDPWLTNRIFDRSWMVYPPVYDIDKAINDLLREGWVLKRLDITLRAIMRAGTFELMFCKDIPVKVCIAEYTSMANAYFNAPEAGMANAIFEKIANTSRS